MREILSDQLTLVKSKFDELKSTTAETRKQLYSQVHTLAEAISFYENVWLGEWFNDNYNLYYNNFNPNSRQSFEADEGTIKRDIEKRTNIKVDSLKEIVTPISRLYMDYKELIISELSIIKGEETYNNEQELLGQIEHFKWGMNPSEYIKSRRPTYAFVTDPSIINRVETPPHISVGAEIVFAFSLHTSYENFDKLVNRLIRQLEIKLAIDGKINNSGNVLEPIYTLVNKFHTVATQLKNRYDKRPTLTIEDEYDVQDLMNALLRANFEDVRKEEYTPSYAGGSTRVDFLLKREKVLIEVKKTRPTLKDKDVGNQLIIDIAHYKSHPDCKHLICFVYDPDSHISNPRGIEDDLNRHSSEDMLVEVFVRP